MWTNMEYTLPSQYLAYRLTYCAALPSDTWSSQEVGGLFSGIRLLGSLFVCYLRASTLYRSTGPWDWVLFCFFQNTLFTFRHLEKLPWIIDLMTFLSVVNPVPKRKHLFEALVLMQFTGYLNTKTNTVVCVCRPVCPWPAPMTRQSYNCGNLKIQLNSVDLIEWH